MDEFSFSLKLPKGALDLVQILNPLVDTSRLLRMFAHGKLSRVGPNQGNVLDRRKLIGRNLFVSFQDTDL